MKKIHLFPVLILLCMLTACGWQAHGEAARQRETTGAVTVPVETAAPETQPPTVPTTQETLAPTEPEPTETAEPNVCLPEPEDGEFVKITDYIPTAEQELFYATDRNFTGQVIYGFEEACLRYGTVKKLMAVAADLEELGLYLKIWDGFRPVSAQFRLWEVYPDPTYVANPTVGYSSHSRGNTVDLTLVDENGEELEMPTGFDDFSARADRDYSDCTEAAAANARILELLMEKHGFQGYSGEWWHYSDTVSYPVEELFEP
ncbi:MAG: D-alanyl-D-alanine carboxypeptidase family protein [Oscillospiraceae bacterium]|nr:D-alanyl-D-alanine carboxypeptidase family protein [Oscillospiraceae bacterium]